MEISPKTRRGDYLHLFVLGAFAIGQPLFDLLSRNPEFFAARQTRPGQILGLVLVLLVALPSMLVIWQWLCGLISEKLRIAVHRFQVTALVALIALPLLNGIPGITPPLSFLGAIIVGSGFLALYIGFSTARGLVSVLSLALLAFPVYFLVLSPIRAFLFPSHSKLAAEAEVGNPIPIVMVVLDELPTTSLMDASRRIDPIRYPNFARIAESATWYRTATTVGQGTLMSLPAILTGKLPQNGLALPTAQNFPNNLFSLFATSHKLNVFESVTSLCPDYLCSKTAPQVQERFGTLVSDIAVVYLHILLPESVTAGLPDITQNWGNFLTETAHTSVETSEDVDWLKDIVGPWQRTHSRPDFFRDFTGSIVHSPQPTLNFIHVPLPHTPFVYLPSGKKYRHELWANSKHIGKEKDRWIHEWAAAQNYQRSLLQLAYVDRLLGELVVQLKATGLWEESLIIIVSDHGASYKVNDGRRKLSETNYMDLLPVLMLVKYPGQPTGTVSDRNVETIDILPTIADVLNARLPVEMDGDSLLDRSIPERAQKGVFSKVRQSLVYFDALMPEMYDTLTYKIDLLGSGQKPLVLQGMGLRRDLLGKQVYKDSTFSNGSFQVNVDNLKAYENFNPEADFPPVRVTGRVELPDDKLQTFDIAVAINGIVQGVGRTYPIEEANEFSIIVPETALRAGENKILVFVPNDRTRNNRVAP